MDEESANPSRHVRVAVCLATYNEAASIERVLAGVVKTAHELAEAASVEVWLLDDRSPDGTAGLAVAEAARLGLSLRVNEGTKQGLGAAYLRALGMLDTEPDVDIFATMDADLQHPPEELADLIRLVLDGDADLVIASRWIPGSTTPGYSHWRLLNSRAGNRAFKLVTGVRDVTDATAGFRVWRADLVRRFRPDGLLVTGYSIQTSMAAWASTLGARIVDRPTRFPARADGKSKLRPADYVEFARNLWRIRKARAGWMETDVG